MTEQMTDEELAEELEKLHQALEAGQEARLKSQERPDEAPVKEHWDTWDRMFELHKEQLKRKKRSIRDWIDLDCCSEC